MAETQSRLRHLLEAEVGRCREADLQRRLDERDRLVAEAFADDDASAVFAVLGDETRYRLARLLSAAETELCVCELEPVVDVSASAVSHALADLAEAGLVQRRKDGNWRYYTSTSLADDLFAVADGADR